jgi:hypothetical protein
MTPGDLHEAQVRPDEEGVRAERAVRLRDPPHHLQLEQQALPGIDYMKLDFFQKFSDKFLPLNQGCQIFNIMYNIRKREKYTK